MSSGDEREIDLTEDLAAIGSARRHRLALGEAADVVEEIVARPGSDPQWTMRVADSVQGLRRAFDAHVAEVERDDGLLGRLRADAPRLANRIGHMYDEHVTIDADLEAVAELLATCGGACDAATVDRIRDAVVDLLRTISRHRQRGADLVYEAYNVDIGGPG